MSDQIIDATPNVKVVPMGRREFAVCLDGRMIATCTRRDDAKTIQTAIEQAAQVPVLLQHIWVLEDALEQKYSSFLEKIRKQFGLNIGGMQNENL